MKKSLIATSIVALFSMCASAQDSSSSYSAQNLLPAEKTYRFKPTHNTFRANYVVGGITSDVYIDYDSKHALHPAIYGCQLDYEHLFGGEDGQHGFRISCSVEDSNDKYSIGLRYIGAAYVYNYTTTLGWVWSLSAGMGWTHDASYGENGFGAVTGVGCDYKICRYVGIGAELRYRSDRFSKPKGYQLKDDEFYGFKHISLLIGPRFYF